MALQMGNWICNWCYMMLYGVMTSICGVVTIYNYGTIYTYIIFWAQLPIYFLPFVGAGPMSKTFLTRSAKVPHWLYKDPLITRPGFHTRMSMEVIGTSL